jgi:hypothetical protein
MEQRLFASVVEVAIGHVEGQSFGRVKRIQSDPRAERSTAVSQTAELVPVGGRIMEFPGDTARAERLSFGKEHFRSDAVATHRLRDG